MSNRRSAKSWFLAGSIVILLDILQFFVILIRRWDALSAYVIYLLSAGMVGLLLFWYIALLTQRRISHLVMPAESPRAGPVQTANAALSIGADIAIRGLFVFGLSISFLLRAVFKLSRL